MADLPLTDWGADDAQPGALAAATAAIADAMALDPHAARDAVARAIADDDDPIAALRRDWGRAHG